MVAIALISSAAFAHNCPNEMKAIDAKMSIAKNHGESMKALGEAKKILGI